MGQRAGQGDSARQDGTGSGMEIHRQKVRRRMEDKEWVRDGERNIRERRRVTGPRQRGGERKKRQ